MTKLLQKAFEEASKLSEGGRMHRVASCRRSLPLSGAGRISLQDHTILGELAAKHWQSTVADELRSLIRKSCDLAYHCGVQESFRRTADRGSTSSRRAYRLFRQNRNHPSLRFKPVHPTRPIYSVRISSGYRAVGVLEGDESFGTGSARTPTMIDFFHNGGVDPNYWLEASAQSAAQPLPLGTLGKPMKLTVAPLTPDRWSDLEAIFNAKGCSVARGCWCMAYRLSGSREPLPPGMTRAQANRAALKALVDAGKPTRPHRLSRQGPSRLGLRRPTRRVCEAQALARDEGCR
jgi:hypothetical protein